MTKFTEAFSFAPWEEQKKLSRAGDLLLLSGLGLFLEILLVRWLGSEVRIFAYFKNFTLISCFFGLGLGFALSRKRFNSFPLFPFFLVATVLFVARLAPSLRKTLRHLPLAEELHVWSLNDTRELRQALVFYAVVAGAFLLLTFLLIPLGQLTGRLMSSLRPLTAYSLNLAGAASGLAAFSLVSFLAWPPATWIALAAAGSLGLLRRHPTLALASSLPLLAAVLLTYESRATIFWTPYQKIELSRMGLPPNRPGPFADGGYLLEANQDYHQKLLNLEPDYVRRQAEKHPFLLDAARAYALPYLFKPNPLDILILGAGAGNDVASALRSGAGRVVAVEIDPVIVEIGRRLHPERPYDSPRVEIRIGDARPFIRREGERYDLVIYGLVDSHTLLSGLSEVRLDNFLYTLESLRDARSLLKPEGVLALSFSIPREKPWLATRLHHMLREVFGQEPLCRAAGYDRSLIFVAGGSAGRPAGPRWQACRDRLKEEAPVPLAVDDWPYLYLRERAIPAVYFAVIGIALALAVGLTLLLVPETQKLDWQFFFLGAAFLLVEVKAVTELALVFGTTWLVNSVAVGGILLVALGANLFVQLARPVGVRTAYALLAASLGLGYFFPKSVLLGLSLPVGGAISALLLCLPVFFAGLIFSSSLRRRTAIDAAFGSNLVGAMFGGFFEYASLALGVRSLYLLALGLYGLSSLFARPGSEARG